MGPAAQVVIGTPPHPRPELAGRPGTVGEELLEILMFGRREGLGHPFHILGRQLGQEALQVGLGMDGPMVGARVKDGGDGLHKVLKAARGAREKGCAFILKKPPCGGWVRDPSLFVYPDMLDGVWRGAAKRTRDKLTM